MVEAVLVGHFRQHFRLLTVLQLTMVHMVLVQGSHSRRRLHLMVPTVHHHDRVLLVVILVFKGIFSSSTLANRENAMSMETWGHIKKNFTRLQIITSQQGNEFAILALVPAPPPQLAGNGGHLGRGHPRGRGQFCFYAFLADLRQWRLMQSSHVLLSLSQRCLSVI